MVKQHFTKSASMIPWINQENFIGLEGKLTSWSNPVMLEKLFATWFSVAQETYNWTRVLTCSVFMNLVEDILPACKLILYVFINNWPWNLPWVLIRVYIVSPQNANSSNGCQMFNGKVPTKGRVQDMNLLFKISSLLNKVLISSGICKLK